MDKSNPSSPQAEQTNSEKEEFKFSISEKLREKEVDKILDSDALSTMPQLKQPTEKTKSTLPKNLPTLCDLDTKISSIDPTASGIFTREVSKRFSTQDTVGKGGMGIIRAVVDNNLHRTLAMKILSTKFLGDENIANAFIEEARITAQLQHPNIIPVHDIGNSKEDGSYFYTMKLVDGESLQDVIDQLKAGNPDYIREYNLYTLLDIFRKVCDAVAYAHAKGVIHRDIKPGNIMVGPYGEVLLLDWGLAKYSNQKEERSSTKDLIEAQDLESPLMTMDGIIKGSLAYLSPEQANGDIKEIDTQTDIFLLGATLYHMLTLQPPYTSKNMVQIITMAENGTFTHPNESEHGARIPEAIVNLILKSMAVDKSVRFKTVIELTSKITDYLEARNVSDLRVYAKNNFLIKDNELGDDTFIIISGKVEISRVIDGKETIIETLEKGAVFGELAALTHNLRTATARALEKTEVMVISKTLMFDEIRKLPPWLEKIVFSLAGKVNSMNDRIHPFLLSNCSMPVLKQLLYLFNLVNTNPDNQKTISIEYLGIIHEISQNLGLSSIRIEEVINILVEYQLAFREKNDRMSLANLQNLKDLITYIKREQNITEGVDYTAVDINVEKVPLLDEIYQRMTALRYD